MEVPAEMRLVFDRPQAAAGVVAALPPTLANRLTDPAALERAVARGYIVPQAGQWHFAWRNKVLCAYLAGRLWCGDYPQRRPVDGSWAWKCKSKAIHLPDKELERLFGVRLKDVRNGYIGKGKIPTNHHLVDALFV